MPRVKRTEICAADEVQAFHLINRCVRRTFLCGKDRRSGRDYSHRKEWIRERLEELAGIFALDILSFAVLSATRSHPAAGLLAPAAWSQTTLHRLNQYGAVHASLEKPVARGRL